MARDDDARLTGRGLGKKISTSTVDGARWTQQRYADSLCWAAEESPREAVRHHRIDAMGRAEARVAQGSTCRGGGAWVFDNSTSMLFLYFYFSLDQLNFRLRRFNFRLRRAYSASASASRLALAPRELAKPARRHHRDARPTPLGRRHRGVKRHPPLRLRRGRCTILRRSTAASTLSLCFPSGGNSCQDFHSISPLTRDNLPRYRVSTIEHSALIERAAPFGSTVAARKVYLGRTYTS